MDRASGRRIRSVPQTEEEAYAARAHDDAPASEVAGWMSSYLAIDRGEVAAVGDTVLEVAGRPAPDRASYLAAYPHALDHVRA